ncbi:MAG: MATE family efflux transporter [Pseudomonadales bacterium]|nr:MATE family efflux transporter [Pseudomonadales bacterium]
MALGSVSMLGAQIAETIVLGKIGTDALAALGYAFPTTITLYAFAGGLGSGVSSVTARTFGAGARVRVGAIVTHAHLLALLVGVVVSLAFAASAGHIVGALGATGEVRQMATDYLMVFAIGFPLFMTSIVGSMLLRATGNAASPGLVMMLGSVGQIILCPILVFGWLDAPQLGVAGAAWAYVISRGLASIAYAVLIARAHLFRWTLRGLGSSWVAIMHVGGPAIGSGLVMPVSMFIITRLLSGHGDAVVAGYNVASRVEMLAHMILWSASSSVEPFVGQNWGAGLISRVRRALKLTNNFALGWGVLTFVVMVTCGEWVVTTWISTDPVVVDVAVWFFLIIPLSIGFMGMTQIASSSFNALGKPFPSVVISLLRTLVVYVPLAILGNHLFGYVGIFIATAMSNVGVGLVAWNWNAGYVRRAAKATA